MKHSIVIALTLATTPVIAADPKSPNEDKPDGGEIICKSTFVVGSKIPTRICQTRDQWAEIQREYREQRRSSNGAGASRCSSSVC